MAPDSKPLSQDWLKEKHAENPHFVGTAQVSCNCTYLWPAIRKELMICAIHFPMGCTLIQSHSSVHKVSDPPDFFETMSVP